MLKCWSLFLGTCRTHCWVHCIDDIEASKFNNLASIRVSMGTSQTACDGEDVCSKAKSLMMLYVNYPYLMLRPVIYQTWNIYLSCKRKHQRKKLLTFKQTVVVCQASSVVLGGLVSFFSLLFFFILCLDKTACVCSGCLLGEAFCVNLLDVQKLWLSFTKKHYDSSSLCFLQTFSFIISLCYSINTYNF